jgi:hypothetical protein
MTNLETYGDLKNLINIIKLKQKGQKIISKGKEYVLDQVLGLIPGASNAKTTFDFLKTAISKPDVKKTNTWLDKLDIDDKMSAIVDDAVENGFMQAMANTIQNEPDNKPLEDDFNMNQKMVDYLKDEYEQRTITGIKENMETQQLRKLIREIILSEIQQTPSDVVNLTKIIKSNTSLVNALQKVDQAAEVTSFLEYILNTINPKITGVNTSALKTAIDNRFTKKV